MTHNPNENQAEKHSAEQSNEHLYGVIYRKGLHEDDYDEAIQALKDAKIQSGVHYGCAICTDTGHTAEQCHHNPLVMARRAVASTRSWRCFHCDEVFNDSEKAKEHFGDRESQEPKCVSAELSTLRKELEAAKKNAGEVLNEMRAYCGECEFDNSDTIMKPTFDRLKKITGELLNNGKDGK